MWCAVYGATEALLARRRPRAQRGCRIMSGSKTCTAQACENAACGHFQPSHNISSYVIRVCSWFDCPRIHCTVTLALSLPARTQYTAALDTRCTAALMLCQRTSTTLPYRQRSGGVHGVAVEPCGAARHAQRNPKRMQTFEESGSPESLGTLPCSSVCLQNASSRKETIFICSLLSSPILEGTFKNGATLRRSHD